MHRASHVLGSPDVRYSHSLVYSRAVHVLCALHGRVQYIQMGSGQLRYVSALDFMHVHAQLYPVLHECRGSTLLGCPHAVAELCTVPSSLKRALVQWRPSDAASARGVWRNNSSHATNAMRVAIWAVQRIRALQT